MNLIKGTLPMFIIYTAILFAFLWGFPVLIPLEKYEITPQIIEQGKTFTFHAKYLKLLPLASEFTITYVGPTRYADTQIHRSKASVGFGEGDYTIRAPEDLVPGEYSHMEIHADFPPFLGTRVYKTKGFTVVEADTVNTKLDKIIDSLENWGVIEITE